MIISPTLNNNNNKNYLVKDGKITKFGWDYLKKCDKKDRDSKYINTVNNYNK